ncbi:MAG: nicotinamide mononucleotide transporter [Clostridia bacterium]|nr:nicotinamide mononucleotide transporter [Clostridia bacterium]
MKINNPFTTLNRFEWGLWLTSMAVIACCTLVSPTQSLLSMVASLIGVTALIFIAKGRVIGQLFLIVFSVFYGIISFGFRYYGEVITYLGMSAPMAVIAAIQWIRHPYRNTSQVKVGKLTSKKIAVVAGLSAAVTVAFYFILKALGNENLIVSTLSVTTSFVAASLTALRSPYYAIGYALNDIVLIALWVMASIEDVSYLSMVICFVVFLINDSYGYVSWRRMERRQKRE